MAIHDMTICQELITSQHQLQTHVASRYPAIPLMTTGITFRGVAMISAPLFKFYALDTSFCTAQPHSIA